MPGARLARSLNVGHRTQGVAFIEFLAPELLPSARIGGNEVHWGVSSNTLSECGVLSVHLSFGRSIPDFGGFGDGVTGVVEGSWCLVCRCGLSGLQGHHRQSLSEVRKREAYAH